MKQNYTVSGTILQNFSRKMYCSFILFAFFLMGGLQTMEAQKMQKTPGVPVICPAKFEDMNSRMAMSQLTARKSVFTAKAAATAELLVTYGPGAEANPEARAAFQFALDIWAEEIVSAVPIKIFADFADLGAGVLASAGPTYQVSNFPGAPEADVNYPAALANSLAGITLFPDEEFDLVVNLGNGIPWYFGTDGNTPGGQFDFVTVALHEAGHGLGFTMSRGFSNGTGSIRSNGIPSIYALFLVDGNGNQLIDFPDPSIELGDAFTGGDLFVNGAFSLAALNGNLPEIYAPSNFQGGSSLAHWDEGAFPAGDINSLMTPQVGSAESNYDIGPITRGHFRDMGWVLADQPPISVSPSSINAELMVGESLNTDINLTNVSEDPVTYTATISAGSVVIGSVNPQSATIGAGETAVLTIAVNTTGVPKGIYEESVELTVSDFETAITIPVTIRVLDGSETPMIVVNPTSFDENVQQFQTVTRNLNIENVGDEDLEYTIQINENDQSTFQSRVRRTNFNIGSKSYTKESFSASPKNSGISALIKANNDSFDRVISSLYATDFENFTLGDIANQQGWIAQFTDNWAISGANAFEGSQHLRGESDGLGADRPGSVLAISPTVTPGDEPFMVTSARVNVAGSGVSWEIIPQSPAAGSVVTRLRFNGDGSIDILDGGASAFVPVNVAIPEGYFDVRIVVDKDDAALTVFFDDTLVYSGRGFATIMEQVVFLSDMATTGSTMDIDNLEITDGDPNGFWLTVSPVAGNVPFGTSTDAIVKFDARALDPGQYSATINVSSNDASNGSIDIPVNLTVQSPPTISVAPDALSESVDVQIDIPPVKTASFTISNSGQVPLEYTLAEAGTVFTPPNNDQAATLMAQLDMSKYGVGSAVTATPVKAGVPKVARLKAVGAQLENAVKFNDSIYYDTGINFPDDFVGLGDPGPAIVTAVKFDAVNDFTLNAVRNAYRTEASTDAVVILEIYRGGTTPANAELLLTQPITQLSADGVFLLETLDSALDFSAGESFWVVHKYPDGISFPQGYDTMGANRADTYFFSSDGGATYTNLTTFTFLTRALSGDAESYITLAPTAGTVGPGQSVEVAVTFNGETLANGTHETDILVNSNDPMAPTTVVATTFEVSGQISNISVSDEVLLFNNVFIGNEGEKILTLTNDGLAQINVSSIMSDNPDFTASPDSGVIAPGDNLEVLVTFAPSSSGSSNGILSIATDANNTNLIEVVLNGVGVDPPIAVLDPQEVSATTDAGTTVDAQITLRNDGNSPLQYSFPDLAVAAALAAPDVKLNNTERLTFEGFSATQEKGFNDTRVGSPVSYSVGTDNDFGYTWIDSDEPSGPIFSFFDISGFGLDATDILGGDGTAELALPYQLEFYGSFYESVFINANGFISFQAPETVVTWVNGQIPEDDGINNIIAGLWADLEPQNFNGSVHVAAFADALVVQWTNASLFLGSEDETVTFQIVVFTSGDIEIHYADVETASFLNQTTVGIENADATDGAQVAFNTAYLKNGLALRFVKPAVALTPFISNVSPLSGVVPAGGSTSLTVTLDATDLNDGTYYDKLIVSSNAPDKSNSTALFELNVVGTPQISVAPESLEFEPLFVGLSSESSFLITNLGTKALEISDIANNNDDFIIALETPTVLEPEESIAVFVTFEPTSVGTITDEITITSNDGFGNQSLIIPISGVGVDPPVIALTPESIDLTLTKGDSATEIVTISNTGGATLNYSLTTPIFAKAGQANQVAQQYEKLEYAKILNKETLDTRVGPAFLNASGGPGTFGYTWVDNASNGPEYEFIDISATGQLANVGADGDETVALPFDFKFFGEVQNNVTIAANGFLTFAPISGNNWVNEQIPSINNPNLFIAPMWTDIEPQNGTGVFYQGTADYFIVQYENTPGFGFGTVPDPVTFQVILFPDGSFKFQYKNVNSTLRTTSTVGIEGPQGMSGLQVIFNSEYLTDGLAVTFIAPVSGTVEPGGSVDIPVEFLTDGLEGGETYFGDIRVSSNDPINPEAVIPVTLEVLDAQEITSFSLVNADSNEIIGTLNEGDVIDINDYDANSFNVVANTGVLAVGSVVFDFNGKQRYRVESTAPYALQGDAGGNFNSLALPLGDNTVTATPYANAGGSGDTGLALTVNFTVIDSGLDEFLSLSLVDADNNVVVGVLNDGDVVDLNDGNFSIIADTDNMPVGSVVFDFNGTQRFRVESVAPYALGGDAGGNYTPVQFPLGINTVTATGYSARGGNGEAVSQKTVSFEVVDSGDANLSSLKVSIYPNPVTESVNITNGGKRVLQGTIHNLSGEVIYQSEIRSKNDKGEAMIDMSAFPKGLYILRLTDESGAIISESKLLKQ